MNEWMNEWMKDGRKEGRKEGMESIVSQVPGQICGIYSEPLTEEIKQMRRQNWLHALNLKESSLRYQTSQDTKEQLWEFWGSRSGVTEDCFLLRWHHDNI
jgi:hypothetical protein